MLGLRYRRAEGTTDLYEVECTLAETCDMCGRVWSSYHIISHLISPREGTENICTDCLYEHNIRKWVDSSTVTSCDETEPYLVNTKIAPHTLNWYELDTPLSVIPRGLYFHKSHGLFIVVIRMELE